MFIINTLRHNAFKEVDIPSAGELYKKLGFGLGSRNVSGDEFIDPAKSKVEMVQEVQKQVDDESKKAEEALAKQE